MVADEVVLCLRRQVKLYLGQVSSEIAELPEYRNKYGMFKPLYAVFAELGREEELYANANVAWQIMSP